MMILKTIRPLRNLRIQIILCLPLLSLHPQVNAMDQTSIQSDQISLSVFLQDNVVTASRRLKLRHMTFIVGVSSRQRCDHDLVGQIIPECFKRCVFLVGGDR